MRTISLKETENLKQTKESTETGMFKSEKFRLGEFVLPSKKPDMLLGVIHLIRAQNFPKK